MSPLERVLAIADDGIAEREIGQILEHYAWFLDRFSGSKEDSRLWVGSQDNWMDARARGVLFGDAVYKLLTRLGENSSLFRYLIV